MTLKNKTSFCILPWVHTHVDTSGSRRLCCHDGLENTFSNTSLEDFWNGEYLRSVRLDMIAGKKIKACHGCVNNITKEHYSPRDSANQTYYDFYQDRVDTTKEDGSLDDQPISFDYRFGNTCNLSCITCSPGVSSSIERNYEKVNLPTFVIKHTSQELSKNEILKSIDTGSLRSLYWAGGEPLLSKHHWEICKYILDKEYSLKMSSIVYNTNLSIPTDMVKKMVLFLNNVSSYKLFLSLDGVFEVGEFLREGLDWNLWTKNLAHLPKSKIIIDITITFPGLLYLKELARFTIENKLYVNLRSIALVGPHVLLSPLALPPKILKKIIMELRKYIFKNYGLTKYSAEYLNYLNRLSNSSPMTKDYGLLPAIYKDSEIRKLILLKNLEKFKRRLDYDDVLSREVDVLKWWKCKNGVMVENSSLTKIQGDWNKSDNVLIEKLGATNVYLRRNIFSNVKFMGIGFLNVEVLNSSFTQCEFRSGKIENVKFKNCVFINCVIDNVNLQDLRLENVRFENKVLKSEDFYGNR